MDKGKEHLQSQYENEVAEHHEAPPAYNVGTSTSFESALGKTVTIDPTGSSVIELPPGSAPPMYIFSKSLLEVGSLSSSVTVSRPDASGSTLAVYAIADRFISPLHMTRPFFRHVTVARSSGIFTAVGLRKIQWTFLTQTPIPVDDPNNPTRGAPIGMFMSVLGSDGIGIEKDLLRCFDGKWVDENDQVVALAREGGAECEGMPVLSVTEGLHQEVMDFLISAWCVTLCGELGKRVHHHHHHKHSSQDQVIA
ncbi:hypothetical protein V8E51_019360 [Hyaloscypha variabilis]